MVKIEKMEIQNMFNGEIDYAKMPTFEKTKYCFLLTMTNDLDINGLNSKELKNLNTFINNK